jgi:hypothetical protein
MQAIKQQRLAALNARVNEGVQREFEIAVARRGITKQKAVEEALRLWISHQAALRHRKMIDAPIIHSNQPGSLNLTGLEIDEILFG